MSIHEMTSTEVVQRCGRCAAENRIALDTLEVGVARDEQTDASVVPLPACPTCRSTEFLLRSPNDEPAHPAPGSFGHLHRLLVDEMHAELVLSAAARIVEARPDARFVVPLVSRTTRDAFVEALLPR